MFKYFITIYLVIAFITAGFILNDYSDCFRMRWTNLTPSAVGAGFGSMFGGLIWPITIPGMLVLYDEQENRFCVN